MTDTTYTVLLGGDGGSTFQVEGWRHMTADQVATVLEKVTGYRAAAIKRWLSDAMCQSRLGVWQLLPAACTSFDTTPRFLVSRDN